LMLTWWFGALLADMYTGRLQLPFQPIAMFTLLIPFALFMPFPSTYPVIQDVLFSLGIAGLLSWCLFTRTYLWVLHFLERLKPIGDMSYTLYVIHFPILVLLSGWLMSRHPNHLLPSHFGWVLAGILTNIGVAYAAHLVVEKPFRTANRTITGS